VPGEPDTLLGDDPARLVPEFFPLLLYGSLS
jgi:hypothetical protein